MWLQICWVSQISLFSLELALIKEYNHAVGPFWGYFYILLIIFSLRVASIQTDFLNSQSITHNLILLMIFLYIFIISDVDKYC